MIETVKQSDIRAMMQQLGRRAREASKQMARASRADKDRCLQAIAERLRANVESVKSANEADLRQAKQNGLSDAMLDRLRLTDGVIEAMAMGCEQVAALSDPVGEVSDMSYQPSGIQVGKMRVPLGVVGIIYESRPNVTVDAAILCLKAGNATILRGGSEAIYSNQAIANCITMALADAGLPENAVQVVTTADRAAVGELITMPEYIDVIVPRGGKGLIERIAKSATVPTIKHLDGNCHVYIDEAADLDKAVAIAVNAKTHRYGVCNAMETLLVHTSIAERVMPPLLERYQRIGVELRVCAETKDYCRGYDVIEAIEEDWQTEYLAPVLAIKIVASVDEAIQHIADFSSQHTESIVTENHTKAMRFLREVDSASVMVNASTRFADGAEFGLGAEIGISTDKIHVRGPVGLLGLTSQKFIVFGDGHIRH